MKKFTKILATVSDLMATQEFIQNLLDAGVDGVRLNTAHQSEDGAIKVIEEIRNVTKKVPIIIDTKGPEIRTNKSSEEIFLQKGDKIKVKGSKTLESTREICYVNYENFAIEVPIETLILIDDGDLGLKVLSKDNEGFLLCEAENDGKVESRKSINIPGVRINLPSISEKDYKFILFAIENDLDFIAHSFVRDKNDVLAIRKILDEHKSQIGIIAKIENEEGVKNIDEIANLVDGIMVARGDLGIEIPLEDIPEVQKKIIRKCRSKRKFVITATQMLHSMIKKPRPTRAEISDVANAIYDGTDCVMLSGETAYGDYPIESVQTMVRIAKATEDMLPSYSVQLRGDSSNKTFTTLDHLCSTSVQALKKLDIKAFVLDSKYGRTAKELSSYRPKKPILTLCYSEQVMRRLALTFGIKAFTFSDIGTSNHEDAMKNFIKELIRIGQVEENDLNLSIFGSYGPVRGATTVEFAVAKDVLSR